MCGIAAVLIRLARAWLEGNPRHKAWCVETLIGTISSPPPWGEFDLPESVGSHDWEHFACEALPVLWAEQPENPTYRKAVGHLVFSKHYGAASQLMRACFESRETLGSEYWLVVDLMIKWAFIRWDLIRARNTTERKRALEAGDAAMTGFLDRKRARPLRDWLPKLLRKTTATPTLSTWARLALDLGDRRHRGYRSGAIRGEVYVTHPAIDFGQLKSMFDGAFGLDAAHSHAERIRFVSLWQNALDVSLASTRPVDAAGHPLDLEKAGAETATDFEIWVLEQIALVVSQMTPEEQPRRLWVPILALGVHADFRARRFLGSWYVRARESCPKGRFLAYLREMIEFALATRSWRGVGRSARESPGLWLELLGILRFSKPIWTDDDRTVVRELAPLFERALPFVLNGSHESARFLDWLADSSAQDVRLRLFGQIADYALEADDSWLRAYKLDDQIARFLCCLWANHQTELTADAAGMQRYRSLLARLADLQNPIALELQHTISSIPSEPP